MISIESVTCVTSPMYYNDELSDEFMSPSDSCVICCPEPVIYTVRARKFRSTTKEQSNLLAQGFLLANGPSYAQRNPSYHRFQMPDEQIIIGNVSSLYLDYNLSGKKGSCCNESPTDIQFKNIINCMVSPMSGDTIRISKKMKDFNGDFSFDILTLCNDIIFSPISVTGRFLYIKESSSKAKGECNKCNDKCNCNENH